MARTRSLYRSVRALHLYVGLFISPFVVVYAISAIVLNHAILPWGEGATPAIREIPVSIPDDTSGLAIARSVRAQIGTPGEIGYVNRDRKSGRIEFPIETPGVTTKVRVEPGSGVARVATTTTGVWSGMVYLHKMPGPHNVSLRGNWPMTKAWGWVADANVYLLLFASVSGLYLWAVVRADRRAGLAFLGAGVVSFVALVAVLIA
jgi:hypothetical protein